MRKVTDEPVVAAVAEELHATTAQVGLAWLLQHAPNILVIPGTTQVDHLRENVDAAAITFTPAQLAALDEIQVAP